MSERFDIAFLHGGGQGSWVWESTMTALRLQGSDAFGKLIALDVPGCGVKRGRETEGMTPRDVAVELIDDLEKAGGRNVVLVGHSLAGNLLPALAELRPTLFRRLVYVSCSMPLPGQTVLQMMGRGAQGSDDNEVGWPVDPSTSAVSQRYEVAFCNDMTEIQKARLLPNLEKDQWPMSFFSNTQFDFQHLDVVPATYVMCLRDRILPVPWQERFAARFHAKTIVRVDAGHQVMMSRPQALAEIILNEALASAGEQRK